MVFLLIAHMLVGQAPEVRAPVAVVVTSKRPKAEGFSAKVAGKVFESLRKEGISPLLDDAAASKELQRAGFDDPKSCNGGQTCVAKLAVLLGAKAVVVGVDVGKISKSLAIHLEAMAADTEEPLATADFVTSADKWADKAALPISQFAKQLKEKLAIKKRPASPPVVEAPPVSAPMPERTPDDAPTVVALSPSPQKTRPNLDLAKVAPKHSKTPGWVLAGTAVAAAGAAGAFAAFGFADKAAFDSTRIDLGNGEFGSSLTQQQARGLASSANTKLTVALLSGIAALALGGASVYFFTRD